MDSREKAILKTLLYSSLFDYPLEKDEIYNFLIAEKITQKELTQGLKSAKIPIDSSGGFFFLKGNQHLVKIRQAREIISFKKLSKAKRIIRQLSLIPTIKLIGISGTLAMQNCREVDDIDIFVIAQEGLAWTTRFLIAGLLILLGVYRNKNSKHYQDKICLNLVIDESRMLFENKDLFTAHEIAQLLPIFERGRNKAVFKKRQNLFDSSFVFLCRIIFLEKILRALQFFYMKKAITKERLEEGFIGLHPFDYKSHVLKQYNKKIRQFGFT
jgi:hypothetical protein